MTPCKTPAAVDRQLDEALADSFPASDPPSLTEPAGDAREASGCCCGPATPPLAEAPAAKAKPSGCCAA